MGANDADGEGRAPGGRGGSGGGRERHLELAPTADSSGEIPADGDEIGAGEWSGKLSGERGVWECEEIERGWSLYIGSSTGSGRARW